MRTEGTHASYTIGDAAKQQAQIAQAMSEIANIMKSEKDRAKVQDPLIEKIVNQQISSGDANARRSEEQWKIYRDLFAPVESVRCVMPVTSIRRRAREERRHKAGDRCVGYEGALASNLRAMKRMA